MAEETRSASRSALAAAALIFAVLLASYGFFLPSRNGNALPRLSLAASMVTQGRLSIDDYAAVMNIDKAYARGHYYSDKAPGLSFLALPWLYAAQRILGIDLSPTALTGSPENENKLSLVLYIATLGTCGVVTAAAGACLFLLALRRFDSYGGAVFATLAYGLGTPTLGWAVNFLGHAISGAGLVVGLYTLTLLADVAPDRRSIALGLGGGLSLGLATLVEYTVAPAAILIALASAVAVLRRHSLQTTMKIGAAVLCGGLLPAIPLLIYNALAFGSPFTLGYADVQGYEGMREGVFGVGMPSFWVLFEITFSRDRGIFLMAPVLLATPLAIALLWRDARLRAVLALCSGICVYFLLFNSGYFYWNGGDSLGPRHITPMLGIAALPLAGLWGQAGRGQRLLLSALLAVSVLLSVAGATFGMTPSGKIEDPLFSYILPRFFAGEHPAIIKHLFGPTGLANFLPLVAAWIAGGVGLWRLGRAFGAEPSVGARGLAV